MKIYDVPVQVLKQEDGLWRVVAPSLPGCRVDAPTLHEALCDIQEGIAMFLDLYEEEGQAIPLSVRCRDSEVASLTLPVIVSEHPIKRPARKTARTRSSK